MVGRPRKVVLPDVVQEKEPYNNREHFVAAIMMGLAGVPHDKIAKKLGYARQTIEKWFNGGNEEFSKELMKVSTRQLLKFFPKCMQNTEEVLYLVDKVKARIGKKKKWDEDDFARYFEAVKLTSRRGFELIELLQSGLQGVDGVNIFAPGGTVNLADKQLIINTAEDALMELQKIQNRAKKMIGERDNGNTEEIKK